MAPRERAVIFVTPRVLVSREPALAGRVRSAEMDEKIDRSRRDAVLGGAVLAGTAALLVDGQARAAGASARSWDRSYSGRQLGRTPSAPGDPGRDYVPSVTPGGSTLPWRVVDGAKIYHLAA